MYLKDIVQISTQKISYKESINYVSTENMLPNKGGVVLTTILPSSGTVSVYRKGDILLSNIRPYFKKIWRATCNGTASNDVIVFRANEHVDNRYLYYILTDDRFFAYVMTGAKGTKMPRGDKKQMLQYLVHLPPLEEQKRIAGILGALDDKIELLQKQNKTLEDMAKAIFKSWFVDFDVVHAKQKGLPKADIMREYHLTDELYDLFPSDFENSSLGPIPHGWQVKTIQDVAKISSGKRPKSVKTQKTINHNIAVYGGNGIKWWTNEPLYTIPIIITGRVGTLGQVYRIYEPIWVSDNALIFETNLDNFEYLFYMLKKVDFSSFNRGSTQPLITQSDIKNIQFVYEGKIIKEFHNIVVQYENRILLNKKQIQTLTELRDTLLPPLISGKIRV
ncbi:MAG: restriction endonuclease subunit S [Elusimicrobiaceae bacterium]|nr:restriction endonuclease subunit S [Elusimicrobiaceae bacterium]